MIDYIALNKLISKILRHEIERYDINYTNDGWIAIDDLLDIINREYKWNDITQKDIHNLIHKFDKQRFEINDNRIRALYGHTLKKKIVKESIQPPDVLYHGTLEQNMDSILNYGISSQSRQYVHLAVNKSTAIEVAKRRKGNIVILKIHAKMAFEHGIEFYVGNNEVILSERIPPEFIEIESDN